MPPELSVVTVNYRKGELLLACLDSVYRTAAGLSLEVIVVDNASGDDTATILPRRFPAVRLILNPANVGFARATNRGMAAAAGSYLLWLNPDTVVQEGALQELLGFLRAHPEAAAVGPRMVGPDGHLVLCRSPCWHGILHPLLLAAQARNPRPSATSCRTGTTRRSVAWTGSPARVF
jgi:GT2 family glycosyltransferase